MATLAEISKKLSEGNDQTELNRDELIGIRSGFDEFLRFIKEGQLDKLEEAREKKSAQRDTTPRGSKSGDGLFPGLALPTGIAAITSGIIAVGASLTGLDDALRGAFIVKTLGQVGIAIKDTVKAISIAVTDFKNSIKNFGTNLKNVFVFDDDAKKAFTGFVDDLRLRFMIFADDTKKSFNANLTEFDKTILKFPGTITGAIGDIFTAAKASILTTIPESSGTITTKVSDTLKPVTGFFTSIFDNLSGLGKLLPTINFEAVKAIFVGAEGTGGLFGFLSKIFAFFRPILRPIEFLLKTALRPFTQILLSVIDFVVGFFKGFKAEDGTFLEKLTAGLEGGIKGVIKGFTQAIDMIFIEFPAWILKTLGFTKISDNLKKYKLTDLVDPIYDAIKAFFNDPIGITKQVMGSLIKNFFGVIEESIKGIIRSIAGFLPDTLAKKILGEEEFEMMDAQRDRVEAEQDVKKGTQKLQKIVMATAELEPIEAEIAEKEQAMKQTKAFSDERKKLREEINELQKKRRQIARSVDDIYLGDPQKRASQLEKVQEEIEDASIRQREATERQAAAMDRAAGGSGIPITPGKGAELEYLSQSQGGMNGGVTVVDAKQTSGDTVTTTNNQVSVGDMNSTNRRFNTDMLFQE